MYKRKPLKVTLYKNQKEIRLPHIEKVLTVDLAKDKIRAENIQKEIASNYIGGRELE